MSLAKNDDRSKTNHENRSWRCQCALLTGIGRSAVAVIGVRGADAAASIRKCFAAATQRSFSPDQIRYGRWIGYDSQEVAEAVIVVPMSDDEFEIHCHGGAAAATRIINDLRDSGAECRQPDEWSIGVGTPLLIHEATQMLSRCLTTKMAAVALDQVRGALLNWCSKFFSEATLLSQATFHSQTTGFESALLRREATEILARAELGLRLGDRFNVVLLGAPNVGKSSLVNAIVGYDRSITMDLAGTTRDVLHAETVVAGIPIRLSDTAGIRQSDEAIEKQGVLRAQNAADQADLVVVVRDPQTETLAVPAAAKTIEVFNKADLPTNSPPPDGIRTVATTGQGVEQLMQAIADQLVQFPPSGAPVPVTQRQVDLLSKLAEQANHDAIIDSLLALKS